MISADVLERPKRAPEVELVGQTPDSGLTEDQWLICYEGSDYVQVTTLIYHILLYADGQTPVEEIARRVGLATQKAITADQVRWLITNRLASSGLLVVGEPAGGHTADTNRQAPITPPKAPLLGIRYRLPLLPYEITEPVTAILKYLYWRPVMVAVVIAAVLINGWLYFKADLGAAITTVLSVPELSLLVFVISLIGNLIHELGHGSALRRAGCRHGTIGIGLLWIWPVVYTDVSHIYRLNRRQRIQVDLGGIYFNLVTMVVLYIAYLLTGQVVLLASIIVIGVGILREFNLFARFDGYYLVADIMGVPEPLSLVGPFVRQYVPWRGKRGKRLPLRPFAQTVLVAYLLLAAADLALPFVLSSLQGQGLVELLWQTGLLRWQQFIGAWLNQGVVAKIGATVDLGLWLLIPLSLGLITLNVLRQTAKAVQALSRRVRIAEPISPEAGPLQPEPAQIETGYFVRPASLLMGPANLEQLIETAVAKYASDLRAMVEALNQLYKAEVAAVPARNGESSQQQAEVVDQIQRIQSTLAERMQALDSQYARYVPGSRLSADEVRRAKYAEDVRIVVEELRRFYDAQIATKDAQFAEISKRAAVAEQACAALEMRIRVLEGPRPQTAIEKRLSGDEVRSKRRLSADDVRRLRRQSQYRAA